MAAPDRHVSHDVAGGAAGWLLRDRGHHTSFGPDYAATYGSDGAETAYDYVAGIVRGIVAGPRAEPAADDFEAYCRETVDSVVALRHSVIFRKKSHRQPWLRRSSVADASDAAWMTPLGQPYARLPGSLSEAPADVVARFEELSSEGPVEFAPAASGEVRDVVVHGQGVVATSGGLVLEESLNCAQNLRRASGLHRPYGEDRWVVEQPVDPTTLDELPVDRHYVLLKQTWDRNYGHWLIDTLPKVGLLEGHLAVESCVFLVNRQASPAMARVVTDSLPLAGIAPDQVITTDQRAYALDRLTVLGTISRHPTAKSPFAIRFLEGLTSSVSPAGHDRIYVTRNSVGRRILLNEAEALEVLRDFGYVTIAPEELSLVEQVATFMSAHHVVGNMGAALANLAFSPAGVSVLTLATPTMKHDFYYDIVCHKLGAYHGLQGSAAGDPPSGDRLGLDFVIDTSRLRDILRQRHPQG